MVKKITASDVVAAQKTWGEGIVAIAAAHSSDGDFEAQAREHINSLYAYDISDVMFKLTLACLLYTSDAADD